MANRKPSVERGPTGELLYPTGLVMERAGVSRQQVYKYQAMGLIQERSRDRNGYRLYPEEVFRNLEVIKRLNGLGYSLRDIQEIFGQRLDAPAAEVGAKRAGGEDSEGEPSPTLAEVPEGGGARRQDRSGSA